MNDAQAAAYLCEAAASTITTDATQAARAECLRSEAAEAQLASLMIERDACNAHFGSACWLLVPDGSADALEKGWRLRLSRYFSQGLRPNFKTAPRLHARFQSFPVVC
jgi:hypothetical protein